MKRTSVVESIKNSFLAYILYMLSLPIGDIIFRRINKFFHLNYVEENFFYEHYFKIDTISMLVAIILLYIFIRRRAKELKYHETEYIKLHESLRGSDLLKNLVILLSLKGIINLWFLFLDKLSTYLPYIGDKMASFEEMAGSTSYEEPYFYLLMSIVILGPLAEELLFRGVVINEFRLSTNKRKAIVISAILFGIFHMDLIQMTYTILMGLFLGYIYIRYKSFVMAVGFHILNNFLETLPPSLEVNENVAFYLYMTYFICIIPGIVILIRELKKTKSFG